MKLKYNISELDYSIDSILQFHDGALSEYWTEPLFYFYPQVDKQRFKAMEEESRREYLNDILREVVSVDELGKKKKSYQAYWDRNVMQIQAALEEAFEISLEDIFGNMVGTITLNPICPRYLDSNTFDIFYLNSERGALGTAIHEIIHFVWFYIWNEHFNDKKEEYEAPHMIWVFSEMVVDTIIRNDERLYSINPYFEEGVAYDYFYSMTIEGVPILETLNVMYENNSLLQFMEEGYEYCLKHETVIRNQME